MTKPNLNPTRRSMMGMIAAAAVAPRAAFAAAQEAVEGRAFGTTWRAVAPAGQGLEKLRPAIDALFAEIDRQLSPWRPDSAISRFNLGAAHQAAVDPALTEVTASALEIARHSEGAFDPTVGPLVARWGFGPIGAGGAPDWRGISVGQAGVVKARGDLTLDLCGIAKGWALDRAMGLAASAGVHDLLFDLGGEFAAAGHHPEGRSWRVGIEVPNIAGSRQMALRLPQGMAAATSGSGAQSYGRGGRIYGHIIAPRARAPVNGTMFSVTVVAETAMRADAWATALFAAGDQAGPDLAASQGVSAVFQFEFAGKVRHLTTGRISELIL